MGYPLLSKGVVGRTPILSMGVSLFHPWVFGPKYAQQLRIQRSLKVPPKTQYYDTLWHHLGPFVC